MSALQAPPNSVSPLSDSRHSDHLPSSPLAVTPPATPSLSIRQRQNKAPYAISRSSGSRRNRHNETPTELIRFARIRTSVEFACPICSKLNLVRQVNHRTPVVVCSGMHCKKRFSFGCDLSVPRAKSSLMMAFFTPHVPGRCSNNIDLATTYPIIGRITGLIDWQCSNGHLTTSRPAWDTGNVRCGECGDVKAASLIIYKTSHRVRQTPLDWIQPISHAIG